MQERLDYAEVKRYWDEAATSAAAASYMAHEQGLPQGCVDYRFKHERAVVDRWFSRLPPDAAVLDIGCGAGAWSALFSQRFGRVVGVELSTNMIAAAGERLSGLDNVELIEGDALKVMPEGQFDGAFLGGLLMYVNRDDAVDLLRLLAERIPNGPIILRESTVRKGVEIETGDYNVAYRCPDEYEAIASEAGLRVLSTQRNQGYARMEVAVEVVNLIRRIPPLGRRKPSTVGRPVWKTLSATAPVSLGLIPRGIEAVGLSWPHLTNHFMLLQRDASA